ncbi:MAG TPA: ThiF family adenylyltransferase [Pirellulaceae bacterium]|nr:ThiF family adenylyltransferase [Pirellulaceae bacterium]
MTDFARYIRQMRFKPWGESGQQALSTSRALVVGCGALGSVIINTLARAGVGHLRIVDRDFLELNNLQRQVIYDEDDVAAGLPKAIAAANKLRKFNSQIIVEPLVVDVSPANIADLVVDADVIVDGTDNFETRFLLNDAAAKYGIPWIYGGCLGAEGQTMTILPGETPCLRCLMPDVPPPGSTPTCDTAGILSPIINVIASLEAMEALKILAGRRAAINRTLTVCDLWDNRLRQIKLDNLLAQRGECPTCSGLEYPWLDGTRGTHTAILCGRNAVQLSFPGSSGVSLAELEQKLSAIGKVTRNPFLLRFSIDDYVLTVFPDGRAIVAGTEEIAEAKSIYAKYIGS